MKRKDTQSKSCNIARKLDPNEVNLMNYSTEC